MNFLGRVNPIASRPVQPGQPAQAPAARPVNPAHAIAQGGISGRQFVAGLLGKKAGPAPVNPAQAIMEGRITGRELVGRLVGKSPPSAAPAPQQGQGRAQQLRDLAARQAPRTMPRPALRGLTPDLTGRQQALTQAILGRRI